MSKIIVSDKGYLHVSLERKEYFRSSKPTPHRDFPDGVGFVSGGQIDFQRFDDERQSLNDGGFTEAPNPHKLFIRLDYFKESGKWYSEGFIGIDKPVPGEEAKSWYDFMEHVRELQAKGELPGLIQGSKFEVLVTGSEHPGGYPQIFRLEK